MQLHTKIFLGLVLGVAVGAVANATGFAATPAWRDVVLPPLSLVGDRKSVV